MADTKGKILEAATEVFALKGKHGAGMEEIAHHAGVNKAMVYYYFSSKENLHYEIIKLMITRVIRNSYERSKEMNIDPEDPVGLIKLIIRIHFTAVVQNRDLIKIFLSALANEPETVKRAVREALDGFDFTLVSNILQILNKGLQEQKLRNINPMQLVLSILGMNLFFFLGKPMAEVVLGLNIEDEELFLQERLNSIQDLVLYGVANRSDK